MGTINNILLIIITALATFLPIMLFIFLENRERQSIPKQDTIKDYIEEFIKKYTNCQLVEMDSKIKKIILKNDVIELHYSNEEVKIYQLDQTNIKYNILGSYRPRHNKFINIYFNNDKYTSLAYNIYNFEPYIAFVILVNLLKRNELEKINNLNDDEIKRLQQNFTYNEK